MFERGSLKERDSQREKEIKREGESEKERERLRESESLRKRELKRERNVVHHVTVQSLTSTALNIDQDLRKKIKLYQSIHDTLCDVCELVNEIFSIQCLLISAALFSDVTFCFYRVFQEIFAYYQGQTVNLFFLISFTCWSIISSLCWVVMVVVVSRTSEEANRTGSLIHVMRCPKQDSIMDYEIEIFMMQLLHRKVTFTAFDFLPIDCTLLYSIIVHSSTNSYK
ncbi:unnamed protein product [Timema podura]|uniref:Gustatory receptor n=1 Tax=Timema podura TaxID=61482 RepID=A0ABN7NHV2_TIMPD|nr:unnamed protein product [Timema podura]